MIDLHIFEFPLSLILALAVIVGFASLFSTKIPESLPERLLSTASSLLLIGMMCGAVWAKQTWYGVNHLPSSTQSLHTYNQEKSI